tara:strand:+ start:262 stop:825 length:564 start_codon:yes stop_codon:yes gene_type:complete
MTLSTINSGWLEVICGCMFSGKTEELMRRLRRAQIAKMSTIIFKPKIDSRYSENEIVSHNKNRMNSKIINSSKEIIPKSKSIDVIAVDEAQFFDENLVQACTSLANNGKRVIVAGLDKDYRGLPFGPMPSIMCEADYLDKLRAICIECGNLASYSQRMSEEKNQIVIGELDKYQAKCRNCFQPPHIN